MFKKPYNDLIGHKIILIRLGGEMGIKSRRTRRRMTHILQRNIKELLSRYGYSYSLFEFRGRIILVPENSENINIIASLVARNTSGISSLSPASVVGSEEKEILATGVSKAKKIIPSRSTFAVRARREGKHTFTSMEIAAKLGKAIIESEIQDLKVSLTSPEYEIFIDIRDHLTFIHSSIISGIDGIPSQSQGTLFALIRPNLNSVLAAWLMKKRGVQIKPLFFKTGKFSEEHFIKFVEENIYPIHSFIEMKEFFEEFKFSDTLLCQYCQMYCESITQEFSAREGIKSFISPTCFNFNNEKMSLDALKFLENRTHVPVLRPIQLGFFGKGFDRKSLDVTSCCPFRKNVNIIRSTDINEDELEVFIQKKTNLNINELYD
ncbi:MAG: THUMP domain-containing protein [Candidatus Hodarchaeales archaeon]|jgi:adenylyl- and sulfurtransferase ThiI